MTTTQAKPKHDPTQKRFKGSLAGTLVRTLLIFTFIPLALMAGVAYFRARTLLQQQAVAQSQNLLSAQIKTIDREVTNKEIQLGHLLESSDFKILIELALHANPKSNEFHEIRNGILQEFNDLNAHEDAPSFDQFLLLDTNGNIKIASDPKWQGKTLDRLTLEKTQGDPSIASYGLSPIYENEFLLVTVQPYRTESGSILGSIVGVTEKKNLQKLFRPLNGLSPLATTYLALSDQRFVSSDPETGEFRLVESNSQNKIYSIFSELITQESSQPETLEIIGPNGEDALALLQWFPRIQTGVVFETRTSDISNQISSLIPFTVLLILGALLAIGLIMVIGTNRVIKPLRSLSDITRGFADGDWSRRAKVSSNDEVGLLASSFNQMADELEKTNHSLEQKVDKGERQIRATTEVPQNITTLSNLNETFNKTVELLVQQFGFYQASIFLIDPRGKNIEFKTGFGPATEDLVKKKYRLGVDSASMIGWASSNNQARIASNVLDEPLYLRNELLTETRSEASLPISTGNLVLGVLDVQSTEVGAFDSETVIMLQNLASQIATAIQSVRLAETNQVNFEELARLYRSSRMVAKANTEQEILATSSQILKEAPYPVILLQIQNKKLTIFSSTDSTRENTTLEHKSSKV